MWDLAIPGDHDFCGYAETSTPAASAGIQQTYYMGAGEIPILVHNDDYPGVGMFVNQNGVTIQIYSNDHALPHAHVKGGGPEVKIGQNGKPIAGDPELTKRQQQVVDDNIKSIRGNIRSAMARYAANGGC